MRAFIERVMEASSPEIKRATVPIFAIQDGIPIENGTGVLLQIADTAFLVSAAHVMDYATKHDLPHLISNGLPGSELIPLHNVTVTSTSLEGDLFDLAVVRLPEELAVRLRVTKRFVRLSEIDPDDAVAEGSFYFVYGYPYEWTKTDTTQSTVRLSSFRFGGTAFREKIELKEFRPELHLLISSPPDRIADADGNLMELPKLGGISGCGMWRLSSLSQTNDRWSTDNVRLVAIEHAVAKVGSPVAIKGTRFKAVLQMIKEAHPELRQPIGLTFPAFGG
jgi:hypothetical protein